MDGALDFLRELTKEWKPFGRWLVLLGIVLSILLGLVAFELVTHSNYYSSLERKTELLSQLNTIAIDGVSQRPELYSIYNDIVRDLSEVQPFQFSFDFPDITFTASTNTIKAITGASFWIVLLILTLGTNIFGSRKEDKKSVVSGLAAMIVIFGGIGYFLPVIFTPWVNYIGFPLLQIYFIYFLFTRT